MHPRADDSRARLTKLRSIKVILDGSIVMLFAFAGLLIGCFDFFAAMDFISRVESLFRGKRGAAGMALFTLTSSVVGGCIG
jgi:hypothetical protein